MSCAVLDTTAALLLYGKKAEVVSEDLTPFLTQKMIMDSGIGESVDSVDFSI